VYCKYSVNDSGHVTVFDACRYLNEVDQLISYLADIHQPHEVLPDIVLVHALDVFASRSAAVICLRFLFAF